MRLPNWLHRALARLFPRASLTGDFLTYTATQIVWRVALGLVAVAMLVVGLVLLGSDARAAFAGALLAWAVAILVWTYRSFGEDLSGIRDGLRKDAEFDLLHARLNLLSHHLGIPAVNLNEVLDEIVRARMERLAHFGGLDEMRLFGDAWQPGEAGYAFWSEEAQGLD